ncbi:hypothetical protein [Synechococcus phage Yong-M3-232]|nr:hypothetical protein [Synechococcus phage Yong-M3-232]
MSDTRKPSGIAADRDAWRAKASRHTGALASIIADPDCCAVSKTIARNALREGALTNTRTQAEAASKATIEELVGALRWYADQLCEGWCEGKDPRACASIGADNCAGCPSVVALNKVGERA